MAFGRYYIKFVTFESYEIIDRYFHDVIASGTLEQVNTIADSLVDVDDEIHY